MDKSSIADAIRSGRLVECDEQSYPEVRRLLQEQAAEWADQAQIVHAQIALTEVRRLDGLYRARAPGEEER